MSGRRTRKTCPFCQHPERDDFEANFRAGIIDLDVLDRDQGWPNGTSHTHMRRHSGQFSNQSNVECPVCTHPERAEIESSILDQRASITDFSEELDIAESTISYHLEKHTKPLIQRQANIEVLPKAIQTTTDSLQRVERNMNRMDNILSLHLDRIEEQMLNSPDLVSTKDLDLGIKLHREVRETLGELAKWMDKLKEVDKVESVSVITILQQHFSEKAPDEWRTIRLMLAEAGVMDE